MATTQQNIENKGRVVASTGHPDTTMPPRAWHGYSVPHTDRLVADLRTQVADLTARLESRERMKSTPYRAAGDTAQALVDRAKQESERRVASARRTADDIVAVAEEKRDRALRTRSEALGQVRDLNNSIAGLIRAADVDDQTHGEES